MADLPAWIFASLCLIGFLLFAAYNGFIAWCQFVLSAPASSFAPLAGGCLGVGAVLAAPLGSWSDRLPYVLIPLVLDSARCRISRCLRGTACGTADR